MFTGLVQGLGAIRAREQRGSGCRLKIATPAAATATAAVPFQPADLVLGESIAVQGACLTVAEIWSGGFLAEVSQETLSKTTLGDLALGQAVNLERALRVGSLLGGHWVTGHVDAVGRIAHLTTRDACLAVTVTVPDGLAAFLAPKGSVTVDGVSLTINAISGCSLELMLVPHTLAATMLHTWRVGHAVNLEVDPLSRYAVHYLRYSAAGGAPPQGSSATDPTGHGPTEDSTLLATLERAGFMTTG